jgi:hypothetical protein
MTRRKSRRRRRRHTYLMLSGSPAAPRGSARGEVAAAQREREGSRRIRERSGHVFLSRCVRSCWGHAWIGRFWAGFDPTPIVPNAHLGQTGEFTPSWSGFPTTRGLGRNTGRYKRCQTKPKRGPLGVQPDVVGSTERCGEYTHVKTHRSKSCQLFPSLLLRF